MNKIKIDPSKVIKTQPKIIKENFQKEEYKEKNLLLTVLGFITKKLKTLKN